MAEQPATLTRRLHQQTRDACECALPATARAPAADSTGTESEPRSSGPPLDVAVASEAAAESTTLLSFAEKDEDTVMLTAQGGERIVVGKNTVQLSALVGTMLADDDDEDHEEDEGADEDEDESDSSRDLLKITQFPYPMSRPPYLPSANMHDVIGAPYAKFVDDLDQEMLFELVLAANYMDIKPLLDLTCAKIATMIKGKTPEEIRKAFNIRNDFTPEEEELVRQEDSWCQEM